MVEHRIYTWIAIGLIWLKSTSLDAQEMSGPLHFFGLWEGYHPIEMTLDEAGKGELILPDEVQPITLAGRSDGTRWKIHEVLADGQLSGEWVVGPQSDHWLGEWKNYNQTSGSLCALFGDPVSVPQSLLVRFFFKAGKQKWQFILFPLPRGKWKGLAWEVNERRLARVTGEWLANGILLDVEDEQSGIPSRLNFLHDRQAWRSAAWTDARGVTLRVQLRNFQTEPVHVTSLLDFSREILLLQPSIDWPGWEEFVGYYLQPLEAVLEQEFKSLMTNDLARAPYQRHVLRLYSWVDLSCLNSRLISGYLHVVSSWGEVRQVPFTFSRKDGMLTLRDLWPECAIPEQVLQQMEGMHVDAPMRIDPFHIYVGQGERTVILELSAIRELLPRQHPLRSLLN